MLDRSLGYGGRLSTFSRRDALRLAAGGALALLVGCSTESGKGRPIRREDGQWSLEDVENAARVMMAEKQFGNIARAGSILYENQLGHDSISQVSSLFVNNGLVRVDTKEEIPGTVPAPADAYIRQKEPISIAVLRANDGGKDRVIQTGSSLELSTISLNRSYLEGKSDFLIELFLAKEVLNIEAFDRVMKLALPQAYGGYRIPDDPVLQRVLKVNLLKFKTAEGVPLWGVADIFAHFLLIPDYQRAKKLGRLSKSDTQGFFDLVTSVLVDTGWLIRDASGNYTWKNDKDLDKALLNAARIGYGLMSGQ